MTGWEELRCLLDLEADRILTPVLSKESLSRSAETGVIPYDSAPWAILSIFRPDLYFELYF
jgi:hypothetical protein